MADVPMCPGCGSDLVQPLRAEQHGAELLVELRCPECFLVTQTWQTARELAALDRRQTASRDQIIAAYERSVEESMTALADTLAEALARDLLGPDDFAPLRRAA